MVTQIRVLIAARNEAATIKEVVKTFQNHPTTQGHVHVAIDADTTDDTFDIAADAGAICVTTGERGKGQNIAVGLQVFSPNTPVDWIFCDADITGFKYLHVEQLCTQGRQDGMFLGVPSVPDILEAPRLWAWPWVTGIRRVPGRIVLAIGQQLHGYCMESQINLACMKYNVPVAMERLIGVQSRYVMTEQRLTEMRRDYQWGIENGVIPRRKKQAS